MELGYVESGKGKGKGKGMCMCRAGVLGGIGI